MFSRPMVCYCPDTKARMEGMKIHAVTEVNISRTNTGIIWNTSSGLFPCTDKVTKGSSKHCSSKRNKSREQTKSSRQRAKIKHEADTKLEHIAIKH
jgi:hypothetical protein